MIQALLLSIGQLNDRRFVMVLVKSMLLTLAIFVTLGVGLWFGTDFLARHYFQVDDSTAGLVAAASLLLAILVAWLLFRVVAVAVIGVFADEVVQSVEAKYYPDRLASARSVSFGRSLAMGLKSAGRAVGINLLLSPIYLILLFTGVGTPIAFFLVNAWLLGRDFDDMVGARHMSDAQLRQARATGKLARFTSGAAGTALFFIPFANLAAPIIGAAMATHLFHRRSVK